jgi:hypothetical protein
MSARLDKRLQTLAVSFHLCVARMNAARYLSRKFVAETAFSQDLPGDPATLGDVGYAQWISHSAQKQSF